jgi:hypothetical protein
MDATRGRSMRTTILDRIKSQEQLLRSQQLAAANVRAIAEQLERNRIRAIVPDVREDELDCSCSCIARTKPRRDK